MLTVSVLREIFRNLAQWRALYESEGLDTITDSDGEEISIFDIEYLYDNLDKLPKRQKQSIELYLVRNMREVDAAVAMNVSRTNPVGIYASVGLQKLLDMIEDGSLPRFKQPVKVE